MTRLPAHEIEEFLQAPGPILDVRSPCEFIHAHIPGACSLPLFTDEERAHVGTVYKHSGHDAAVLIGLKAVGPKMASMAKSIRTYTENHGCCRVTCFRGGMRSQSIQWLCDFLGFTTVRLEGGYKAFRRHVLATFDRPFSFIIIGGPTGSGKTTIIQELVKKGYQAIDLEALANHRGSTFGLLPGQKQPSNEHFENLIATKLWNMDPSRPIFLEDESRLIGSCVIPKGIYEQMDTSPLLWLQVEITKRLQHILSLYGHLPLEWLIDRTQQLKKRLGGERVKTITHCIHSGQLDKAASLLLDYYDHAYLKSRSRHSRPLTTITENDLASAITNNALEEYVGDKKAQRS